MASHALQYLERLAESDHVIAALQEWPGALPNLGDYHIKAVPSSGKVLLLHSNDLELCHDALDASKRATIARFRLPGGDELTSVGLHWHSRLNPGGIDDPYERGAAMALFRQDLDARLGKDSPAVIMGDFNCSAQEHEREMCSPYCLFALSAHHHSTPSMERMTGREKRAWFLVEPTMRVPVGTFFYKKRQAWSMLDHVVLTPELHRKLAGADVLTSLEGHNFLTEKKQVPRGARHASDHLPVVCRINYP